MSKKPQPPQKEEEEKLYIAKKALHSMLDPKPLEIGTQFLWHEHTYQITGESELVFVLAPVDDDPPPVG